MFAIDEAKLPPPTPAKVAMINSVGVRDARGQEDRDQRGRDQQQQGADDRPVPAAERGHGERVRQPERGAGQGRERGQQELPGRVDPPLGAHEQHDHRPQAPDGEADVLGQHGEDQVALGDRRAGRLPELGILGAPVLDPVPAVMRGRDVLRRRRSQVGGRGRNGLGGGAVGGHVLSSLPGDRCASATGSPAMALVG